MRVMVTGGTGFVGSHTTRALLDAGHEVRLLVRSPAKLAAVFSDSAHGTPDHLAGDVTDEDSVARAMEGCDAVFHAAAVVALESKHAQQVLDTNARAVELVVEGAHRRGVPSILTVSSASALFHPNGPPIDADAPVTRSESAYGRSKAEAELRVRRLQDEGAPIRSTYPTGVVGPDDPGLSEGNHTLRVFVRDVVLDTSSGFQPVDVRDLADLHVRLLEAQDGPERAVAASRNIPWSELGDLIDGLTGVRVRRLRVPGRVLRGAGRVGDLVKRVWDFDFPLTREGMSFATQWPGADASSTEKKWGVTFRSPEETFRDTLRWMHVAGHVDACYVGRLAD